MPLRLRAPFLTCASAALVLSACGSSSSGTSSSGSSSTPTQAASTPTSAASPPAKTPSAASASTVALQANPTGQLAYVQKSLAAKAGKVTIAFTNASPVPHNVVIEQASKPVGRTPTISGGSESVTLPLAKGTYTFFCSVDSHRQAGMQGTLTVS